MSFKQFAAGLAAALALAGSAQALTLTGTTTTGGVSLTDYSDYGSDLLSYDLDFSSLSSITLSFVVDAGDTSASFSALVRNLSALGIDGVTISITGASFSAGTITTDGFASTGALVASATSASTSFSPALTTEFYIGNPLSVSGASDWTIDLSQAAAGDVVTLTVAVPEPQTYALLLAGLGVVGTLARRRRRD